MDKGQSGSESTHQNIPPRELSAVLFGGLLWFFSTESSKVGLLDVCPGSVLALFISQSLRYFTTKLF